MLISVDEAIAAHALAYEHRGIEVAFPGGVSPEAEEACRIAALNLRAALAAAPPPAPSDLEQAITACHDRNLNLCTWRTESGEYAATVTTRTYPTLRPTTYRGEGVTLTEAVRAALAAGRSAGEGT